MPRARPTILRHTTLAAALGAAALIALPLAHAETPPPDAPPASTNAPTPPAPQPASARDEPPVDLAPRPLGTPRSASANQIANTKPAATNAAPDASAQPVKPASGASAASIGTGFSTESIIQTAAALGVVLAVLIALAVVARRVLRAGGLAPLGVGAPAPAGVIEVLARYPLARGQHLVLLKIDRRILLVAHGSSSARAAAAPATTLCEITDPEDVASILLKVQDAEGRSAAQRFTELLSRFDKEHDRPAEWSPDAPSNDASIVIVPPGTGLRLAGADAPTRARRRGTSA